MKEWRGGIKDDKWWSEREESRMINGVTRRNQGRLMTSTTSWCDCYNILMVGIGILIIRLMGSDGDYNDHHDGWVRQRWCVAGTQRGCAPSAFPKINYVIRPISRWKDLRTWGISSILLRWLAPPLELVFRMVRIFTIMIIGNILIIVIMI